MSLDKRIRQLEQRHNPQRFIVAAQDYHDDNLFHVTESGHFQQAMTADELDVWSKQQGDNVTIIKIVYPDELAKPVKT